MLSKSVVLHSFKSTNCASLFCFLNNFSKKHSPGLCLNCHVASTFNHEWNLYFHEFSISGIIWVKSVFWIISTVYSRNLSYALFLTMSNSQPCKLTDMMKCTCLHCCFYSKLQVKLSPAFLGAVMPFLACYSVLLNNHFPFLCLCLKLANTFHSWPSLEFSMPLVLFMYRILLVFFFCKHSSG